MTITDYVLYDNDINIEKKPPKNTIVPMFIFYI